MADTFITSTWVTKKIGLGYINQLGFLKNVDRTYDSQYEIGGAKVGDTVQARLPQIFGTTDGQAFQDQPVYNQTVPITLTTQKGVHTSWSSAQATTDINDVQNNVVNPAADALASGTEAAAFATVYRDIYQCVGTPGTTPSTTLTWLSAGTKLTDVATPMKGRIAVVDPLAMQTLANTSITLFNPQRYISDNAFEEGMYAGSALGVDKWYQNNVRPTFTTGTFTASTPVVNGASQTGSTLVTSGWASGAASLKKGDVFTIAGVYSVNPLSKTSTGRLQQFAVTADISDTAGAITIAISPSLIPVTAAVGSMQLANVSASPANSAAITVWAANPSGGTLATTVSPQSLGLQPEGVCVRDGGSRQAERRREMHVRQGQAARTLPAVCRAVQRSH
jgi:hypothetical protein